MLYFKLINVLGDYNIPEVKRCQEVEEYMKLNDLERQKIDFGTMSETTRRFFNDQYLCFYRDQLKATSDQDGSTEF